MKLHTMKILISADMEGISGITHWDQVTPGHPEYMSRSRQLMTDDVNAAIAGLVDGGATEITVSDGHWNASNILIEQLDSRAQLNYGLIAPMSMVQDISQQPAALVFVGYHAMSGSAFANLDHTWTDHRVRSVYLNDRMVGEMGINGAVAGHYGVPVIALSGDQTACAEAHAFFGERIETATVKTATSQFAAQCLPLVESRRRIREAMIAAMGKLRSGAAPAPFQISTPVKVTVDFVHSRHADRAMLLPHSQRQDGTRMEYIAPDMVEAYRAFRAMMLLSRD